MAFFNTFRVFALVFVIIAVYFASNDTNITTQINNKKTTRRAPTGGVITPATQCTTSGEISLTFNNGVSLTNTPVVLDILKTSTTKATFYISPEWVGKIPVVDALIKRMYAEGHTIGFHWWGNDPRNLTDTELRQKLIDQSTTIYNAIGVHPRYMRFPYDQFNQQIATVANNLGLILTFWNLDPADYQLCDNFPRTTPYSIANVTTTYLTQFDAYKSIGGNVKSSFISVHNDICPIGPAIGNVIRLAIEYKYKLVDINTCLGETGSYRRSADSPDVLLETNVDKDGPTSTSSSSLPHNTSTNTSSSTSSSIYSHVPPSLSTMILMVMIITIFSILI